MDGDTHAQVLELQLTMAWAGEARAGPSRLGWWRTAMVDEFGGEDLLRRLALQPFVGPCSIAGIS